MCTGQRDVISVRKISTTYCNGSPLQAVRKLRTLQGKTLYANPREGNIQLPEAQV